MRIRWRGLELPSRVVRDEQMSTEQYGRFTAEPFERGFGTTVGNSLRRILLSSLEGAAVTHIRLKGAEHEFSSIPGVMEDVTDIILNVKSLVVKLDSDDTKEMRINTKKAGAITAGMIEADPSITIVNKDMVIATLTEDVHFDMTLTVSKGRGYVTAAENIEDTEQQLDLSVRANNCLESAKIQNVRELVKKTEGDLLKVRSFGKTSLREVKRKLADLGLSLGMDPDALAATPTGEAQEAAHAGQTA